VSVTCCRRARRVPFGVAVRTSGPRSEDSVALSGVWAGLAVFACLGPGPSESGYDRVMAARVRSVGAIATIYHVEEIPGHTPLALPPEAITPIHVLLRPFAKLAEGSLAISPTSTRIADVPERLADLETQVRRALGILPSRPVEHPGAAWAGVLAELERLSVQTDAETLLGLDFEFVADGELRPALDAGLPG
jgi:hypothetical protein